MRFGKVSNRALLESNQQFCTCLYENSESQTSNVKFKNERFGDNQVYLQYTLVSITFFLILVLKFESTTVQIGDKCPNL